MKKLYQVGEVDFIYKRSLPSENEMPIKVSNPSDIFNILKLFVDNAKVEYKEQFYLLCFGKNGRLLSFSVMFEGGIDGCAVDIRQLMQAALLMNSAAIAVAHNHPSGNLTPSRNDESITKKIREACEVLDIRLFDHLIINNKDYYSFSDNCKL